MLWRGWVLIANQLTRTCAGTVLYPLKKQRKKHPYLPILGSELHRTAASPGVWSLQSRLWREYCPIRISHLSIHCSCKVCIVSGSGWRLTRNDSQATTPPQYATTRAHCTERATPSSCRHKSRVRHKSEPFTSILDERVALEDVVLRSEHSSLHAFRPLSPLVGPIAKHGGLLALVANEDLYCAPMHAEHA